MVHNYITLFLFLIKINDLINDNISNFQEINRNIETITNEVVAEISEKGEGYNIESTDDLSFYNRILLELDRKHYDNCPICLNKDFNQADIINKIKLALKKSKIKVILISLLKNWARLRIHTLEMNIMKLSMKC